MSAGPKPFITPQEYLARERLAPFRSEYYRGKVFAMPAASYKHNLVKGNLARETGNQLHARPCHVLTSDMRVKIEATGLYTYPDVVVICDKPEFEDAEVDILLNPLILAEVLSESTERYDRVAKFDHYATIPSLQEYVLLAQDEPLIERHVRRKDGTWSSTEFRGLDAVFELVSVPVRIPLAEIYRGVEFPESSEE